MSNLPKKTTVYFDPAIFQALTLKAASNHLSVSTLVNAAASEQLTEDKQDIDAFSDRINEDEISYECLLMELQQSGKI